MRPVAASRGGPVAILDVCATASVETVGFVATPDRDCAGCRCSRPTRRRCRGCRRVQSPSPFGCRSAQGLRVVHPRPSRRTRPRPADLPAAADCRRRRDRPEASRSVNPHDRHPANLRHVQIAVAIQRQQLRVLVPWPSRAPLATQRNRPEADIPTRCQVRPLAALAGDPRPRPELPAPIAVPAEERRCRERGLDALEGVATPIARQPSV